ncbi:MAG: ClbS/DfsB family four-helix bundle protein [Phototrophicaceae bacterium]|jgi:hypothetical protein
MNDLPNDKASMIVRMEQGFTDFLAAIEPLTPEQMTVPQDAGGWTIKDHIMHLAVWMDGITALLNSQSRTAAMGIDDSLWDQGFEAINAVSQQQHKDRPLDDVLNTFKASYQTLSNRVESLSEAELSLPYSHYAPASSIDDPVYSRVMGNTFDHYDEHLPWILAIAATDNSAE